MNETEELLRAAMARFTEDVRVPGGLPARAGHQVRRRRITITASLATPLTAAAAVVAIALTGAGPAPVAEARTAAYVVSHTESALAGLDHQNSIQYARVKASGGTGLFFGPGIGGQNLDIWSYQHQQRVVSYTPGGQLETDLATSADGQQRTTTLVTYKNRTWWQTTETLPSYPSVSPTPESSCEAATSINGGMLISSDDWATQIRAALSCGEYKVGPTQQIDGKPAIELLPVHPVHGLSTMFWVDPDSYLPVRDITSFSAAWHLRSGALSTGSTQNSSTIQMDFQWLSPNQASQDKLHAVIPAGFTQVQGPHEAPAPLNS